MLQSIQRTPEAAVTPKENEYAGHPDPLQRIDQLAQPPTGDDSPDETQWSGQPPRGAADHRIVFGLQLLVLPGQCVVLLAQLLVNLAKIVVLLDEVLMLIVKLLMLIVELLVLILQELILFLEVLILFLQM